jgi:hypothetical protein
MNHSTTVFDVGQPPLKLSWFQQGSLMIPYLMYTTPGKPSRSASPVITSAS